MRIGQLIKLVLFSGFIRPASLLWPKDKNLVAFVPREGHRYIDNAMHFFEVLRIAGKLPAGAYLLLADRPEVVAEWQSRGRPALEYRPFSAGGLLRYLRTAVVITDNWQWASDNRISCFAGAKKIQLWHGLPLKKIELSNLAGSRRLRGFRGLLERGLFWLKGRYPRYDIVVSTSPFFTREAFEKSFRARKFVNSGYPRDDYLFADESRAAQVDGDERALEFLRSARAEGKKIVAYVPTFRDSGGNPFEDGAMDSAQLALFAEQNDLIFVIKLHPYLKFDGMMEASSHLLQYSGAKDVAPLLKSADLLITDYSSVFFDYLLLDRPIVFFPYDSENYFQKDRALLFDYQSFTPGPTVRTLEDLQEVVLRELANPSSQHEEERDQLKTLSFEHREGGASLRLWREIELLLRG